MNLLKSLFRILFSATLWVSVGVIWLALWIWFYGPLIGFGDRLPLESPRVRAALIGLLLIVWVWWLWRRRRPSDGPGPIARWRERRRRRREEAAANAAPGAEQRAELVARFAEALAHLQSWMPPSSRVAGWFDRLTRRSRYRLPWFVVAGSAGSGKTALLACNGLSLHGPLPPGLPILPTMQCDWWYDEHAVLVDTPGELLDSPGGVPDPAGLWTTLADLLRSQRARQPLNGLLLAVPADALIAMSAQERTAYAERLAQPLRAMQERLDVRVPVYVCVTHMDRLQGFYPYFLHLGRAARAQAWGVGYAANDPRPGDPNWQAHNGLGPLAKRLADGIFSAFDDEADRNARAAIYLFPREFDAVRQAVEAFCETLFRPSRIATPLHLRGIYFTAARDTPESIMPVASGVRTGSHDPSLDAMHATTNTRDGVFIDGLLRDAIFPDAGFAGTSRREIRRGALWQTVLGAVACGALALLVAGWLISFTNNRAYLQRVGEQVAEFDRDAAAPIVADDPRAIVPMLDALEALSQTPDLDPDASPPLRYRLGLYQGERMREAGDATYQRALREKLLPLIAARMEQQLTTPSTDSEYGYTALKAYLMLHQPTHYDGGFLAAWTSLDLQRAMPPGTTPSERQRIDAHLHHLFVPGPVSSPRPFNSSLVEGMRARLGAVALPIRSYRVLRRELMQTLKLPPFTFAAAGGPQAALVFVRASGAPLTDGIAPLFTPGGYWEAFDKRIDETTASLIRDDAWVLGTEKGPSPSDEDIQAWSTQARQAYLEEYISVWDTYLGDLRLAPAPSLQQSIQRARVLSSPESPLRSLLDTVARDTRLLREDGAKPALPARWRQRMDAARHSLEAVFGAAPADVGVAGPNAPIEAIVDAHFAPIRQLVAGTQPGQSGGGTLDTFLQTVDALYAYLASASAAAATGTPPPPTDVFVRLQTDSSRAPPPLREILAELARGAMRGVGASTQQSLTVQTSNGIGHTCRQMIGGYYPFARTSPRDMPLHDFAHLFGPGGLFEEYFDEHLATQADTSGPRWQFRRQALVSPDGMRFEAGGRPDSRVLEAFRQAAAIRDAYFGANTRQPSFEVVVTPQDTDPEILQYTLTLGGNSLRYAHGPAMPFVARWTADPGQPATLEVRTHEGTKTLRGEGPWAMQRLFDQARLMPVGSPSNQDATFDIGGLKLTLRLAGAGGRDALRRSELAAFRCPS